jgi:uncharacterized protein
MQVTLVLTHACNLACSYCYMGEHFARVMPDDVARAGVELAFSQPGDPWVAFFGGEPLLEWDRMLCIGEAASERAGREGRRLTLQVTTNGTLLTAERARELARRGYRVALSLDGTREAHESGRPLRGGQSSFDAVLGGARHLADAGACVEIIAVTSPSNVRHLGESVAFLAELAIERLTLNPCYEAVWSDEDLAAWEEGLRAASVRQGDPRRRRAALRGDRRGVVHRGALSVRATSALRPTVDYRREGLRREVNCQGPPRARQRARKAPSLEG